MILLKNKSNEIIELNESKNTAIFCNDEKYLSSLMKEIAGINYSTYLYNGKMLFDNPNYFKNRIFINNDYKYINKLNTKNIANKLLTKYEKVLCEDDFKKLVRASNLRFYDENKNKLITEPNATANNCLIFSMLGIKIIHKFLHYINDDNNIKLFQDELKSKKNCIISDLTSDIFKYKNSLDCIYIFNVYNNNINYFYFDSKDKKLLKYKNISLNDKLSKYLVFEDDNDYYFDLDLQKDKDAYIYLKAFSYEEVKLESFGD